jgi:hypothetical protein
MPTLPPPVLAKVLANVADLQAGFEHHYQGLLLLCKHDHINCILCAASFSTGEPCVRFSLGKNWVLFRLREDGQIGSDWLIDKGAAGGLIHCVTNGALGLMDILTVLEANGIIPPLKSLKS